MALRRDEVEGIIEGLFRGSSLKSLISANGCGMGTFYDALVAYPDLADRYALTDRARAELLFDEMLTIADDPELSPVHAKNRLDTRRFMASKLNRARFGESIDVNLNQTVDIGGALSEALGRAATARVLPGSGAIPLNPHQVQRLDGVSVGDVPDSGDGDAGQERMGGEDDEVDPYS